MNGGSLNLASRPLVANQGQLESGGPGALAGGCTRDASECGRGDKDRGS